MSSNSCFDNLTQCEHVISRDQNWIDLVRGQISLICIATTKEPCCSLYETLSACFYIFKESGTSFRVQTAVHRSTRLTNKKQGTLQRSVLRSVLGTRPSYSPSFQLVAIPSIMLTISVVALRTSFCSLMSNGSFSSCFENTVIITNRSTWRPLLLISDLIDRQCLASSIYSFQLRKILHKKES